MSSVVLQSISFSPGRRQSGSAVGLTGRVCFGARVASAPPSVAALFPPGEHYATQPIPQTERVEQKQNITTHVSLRTSIYRVDGLPGAGVFWRVRGVGLPEYGILQTSYTKHENI